MKRFYLAACVLLSGCADGAAPPDAEVIIGEWVVVDFHSPAEAEDRGQRRKRATITEGTWSQQFQGEAFEDFEYTLDPTKSPKHLDLAFTDADGTRLTVRGIYELPDRERLKICLGSPPVIQKNGKAEYAESVRPTAFTPNAGPVISYRRKSE